MGTLLNATDDLPFTQGSFVSYLLSLPEVSKAWIQHTRHPFVLDLGRGSLPKESFKKFLAQDYHFLLHYARFICILASRVPDQEDLFTQVRQALACEEEMKLHVSYCKSFGLSIEDMLATPEHQGCLQYVQFLSKIAARGDWLSLQIALAPCGLGYQVIGESLSSWEETREESNPYWQWIECYSGKEYAKTVTNSLKLLEKYVGREHPSKISDLVDIFVEATKMEVAFWDIALEF